MSTKLSARGAQLAETSPIPEYVAEHKVRAPQADPDDPDRYIGLCVAQNLLMWDILESKVNRDREVLPASLAYDRASGSERFRSAIAQYGSSRIWGRTVEPDNIVTMAGAGSTLESLFYVLSDPGDGVLVPTPSYAGYWFDLETRDGLAVISVHTSSTDGFRLTPSLLETAFQSAERPLSALLLTNPDNPTGRIIPASEMLANVNWAREKGLHIVVNEIYALTVSGEDSFEPLPHSIGDLGTDIHQIWGFSKDFSMSGIRAGVAVSQNRHVLDALGELATWSAVSGDTQHLITTMLEDPEWVARYESEMRQRLRNSRKATSSMLNDMDIPFFDPAAGMFLLADLRTHLDEPTWEAENGLWRTMLEDANVNLTPGSACRTAEPGWFRICFATEPLEVVGAALERLTAILD